MAKICLIWFDLHTGYHLSFHHGLAYIIGTLKRDHHHVSLIHLTDEGDYDKAANRLNKEPFDLVGLSFTTNQTKYVRNFLEYVQIKSRLIIAGGVHATLVREEIFNEIPKIDGICIGEGEAALMELCRRLDDNKDYFSVPSFYFKTKKGTIKNPVSPLQDIDALALPDYALFEYKKVISDFGNSFPMLVSRGCPYNCSYCCNHKIREIYPNKKDYVRFPSAQHAISIIKNNLSLHMETEKIVFNDDILVLNKKWLSDFCNAYKKEIDKPFLCNARIETIDDASVQSLKYAGCISIAFGIESGCEWLRKYVLNRNYSNKDVKSAFALTKKHGIKTFSYNIVGLPFETKEMARDTLKLNIDIQPDYGKCFYFYPYPETTAYQLCKSYDLFLDGSEKVSGILESPSIKEIFMKDKEMIKFYELLNVLFYSRLMFSKVKGLALFQKYLLKMIFLLKKPILLFLQPSGKKRGIRALRSALRRFALTYLYQK